DILEFLEDGYAPETSVKIEDEFLHEVFNFTPKKKSS
nr:hypothetical protein [Tanacetum cinerariifolium]